MKLLNYINFNTNKEHFKFYEIAFKMLFSKSKHAIFTNYSHYSIYMFVDTDMTIQEIIKLFETSNVGDDKNFQGVFYEIDLSSFSGSLPKNFFGTETNFDEFKDMLVKAREEKKNSFQGKIQEIEEELKSK